jgi:hypothetical protein
VAFVYYTQFKPMLSGGKLMKLDAASWEVALDQVIAKFKIEVQPLSYHTIELVHIFQSIGTSALLIY